MTRRLLFDVSGLVQWYGFFRHPSGIQRVTENILRSLAERLGPPVECIARPPGSTCFYSVPSSVIANLAHPDTRDLAIIQLRRLFGDMMAATPPARLFSAMRSFHIPYLALGYSRMGAVWQACSARHLPNFASSARKIVAPSAEDVVIGLGDFWCHRGHVQALVDLKRHFGSQLVHMVHDLFILDRPEWAHPYYGPEFVEQLEILAPHVDRWIVNSRFVAATLDDYLGSRARRTAGIDVIPMGWDTAFPRASTSGTGDAEILARFKLSDRAYVLYVGSVEPRKNLQELIKAFCRLHHDRELAAPVCILVGQNGWKVRAVRKRIADANRNGEVVRWIRDVTDLELATLYRRAQFTVVPSHFEGWGLTVQESLAHGTPCIASRAGGLTESGLDLACYFDPDAPDELYRAIANWVANPEEVSAARMRIGHRMRAREQLATWGSAADRVVETCRLLRPTLRPSEARPLTNAPESLVATLRYGPAGQGS
ncbi:MAG: glycosyltransferase family 4 protein [Reyranella sp.]